MPLSEYEQRVLEQLEHDLGSDPKLGHAMARGPKPRGRVTWSVVGVLVGLAVVLAGAMSQIPLVGIAGFVVMVASGVWGFTGGPSAATDAKAATGPAKAPAGAKNTKQGKGFMNRVEDRFERRRDEGNL